MADAVRASRYAFKEAARGGFDQPKRVGLRDGSFLVMLAGHKEEQGVVVKTVAVNSENHRLGLPSIHSTVLWTAEGTGQPSALIDGTTLTRLRTGAASGVATDLLADRDAHTLAMVGAGSQAADQVAGVCAVRSIQEVRIWSRSLRSGMALASRIEDTHPMLHVRAVERIEEATRDADVICTATPSQTPLVLPSHVREGVHINAVGSYRPDMAELDPTLIGRAAVVAIDDLESAMSEAGDIIQAVSAGVAVPRLELLGNLIADEDWRRPQGLSIFKSVGIAAQDWAIAQLVYQRAAGMAAGSTSL
jgi:ornithine cyclodeaminase